MVLEYQLLRYKPPRSSANGDSTIFSMHSLHRKSPPPAKQETDIVMDEMSSPSPSPSPLLSQTTSSGPKLCFVRVEDSLFKVSETFFLQMPPEMQETTKFTSGLGKTPEKPIFLSGHSSHQFRQVLNAYTSYPHLDHTSMSLDHLLNIGELAYRYQLRELALWFLPIFKDFVTSHQTPLRKSSNNIYVRTMKLAIAFGNRELCSSISTKWVSRMHWRELDPLSALLFADTHGMRDLLSHACYIYLMLVFKRIQQSEDIDSKGLLSQRQKTYIMSGYHSLSAYWSHLRLNPIKYEMAPLCGSHSQCLGAWRLRWLAATDKECPLPEVDILGRLVFVERTLREDMLLSVVLTPGCKAFALRSISVKREMVSRQLHHHFDL